MEMAFEGLRRHMPQNAATSNQANQVSPAVSAGRNIDDSNISVADNRAAQAGDQAIAVVGSGNDFSQTTNITDESTSTVDASQTAGAGGVVAGGDLVQTIDRSQNTSYVDASDRSQNTSYVDNTVQNIDRSHTESNVDASQNVGAGGILAGGDVSQQFNDNSLTIRGQGNIAGDYTYTDASDRSRTVVDHRNIDSSTRIDRSRTNITNTVSDFGAIRAGTNLGALAISSAEQNNIRSLETNLRFGQLAFGAASRAYEGAALTGRENADKAFQLAIGAMGQNKEILLDSINTVAEASKSESLQVAQGNQKTIMAAFAMVAAIFIFGMSK